MNVTIDPRAARAAAAETLEAEAEGLHAMTRALDGALGEAFVAACGALAGVTGRIVVTGMGKSGHVARKIAATFASTGWPAQFVHPAEASHGDLGMITAGDCVLALSRSGDTAELTDLIHHCRRLGIPLIGMTFRPESMLARASTVSLTLPDCGEASEEAPAPTTSTTMCLAMGDALAVALLRAAGFDQRAFGRLHPGGKLGALLKHVRDVMRAGESVPLVAAGAPVPQVLEAMTRGGIGAAGVVDRDGRLIGVVTDGDLRRRLTPETFSASVEALMSGAPKHIDADAPLADAIALMNDKKIMTVFVVEAGRPVGVVHMHDLLTAGAR
jgi:arabinose-5-phosphate isomerase